MLRVAERLRHAAARVQRKAGDGVRELVADIEKRAVDEMVARPVATGRHLAHPLQTSPPVLDGERRDDVVAADPGVHETSVRAERQAGGLVADVRCRPRAERGGAHDAQPCAVSRPAQHEDLVRQLGEEVEQPARMDEKVPGPRARGQCQGVQQAQVMTTADLEEANVVGAQIQAHQG